MERKLRAKSSMLDKKITYKIELIYIKYSPIIISLACLLNNILSYFDIYVTVFNYIFGTSILTLGHMYNSSRTYKFCKYHRMFINYIAANLSINMFDHFIGIPVSDFSLLLLYLILAGFFLFLILYYHQKSERKKYD